MELAGQVPPIPNPMDNRLDERFRQVVEFLPNAVVLVDASGQIQLVNTEAERAFGYPRTEMLGRSVEMLVPERFRGQHPLLRASFFADRYSRPMGVGRDLFARKKNGGEFPVEIGLNPIETDDGPMVLACIVDVTTHKRLVEKLEQKTLELTDTNDRLRHEMSERLKTEQQLRQAQKMEALGQITGGVAHDFNNLLTSVIGNLDMALHNFIREDTAKLLRSALRSAERCARLASQLLAFGRRLPMNVRPVQLGALVTDLQDMLASILTPAIGLRLALAPDLWPVPADPTQIELALINLTLNARDAMPSGGTLSIEARNLPADEPDRPDDLNLGADYVALIVTDSGTGMSEEVRAHAFEPFFTTKDVGKGTGLGLSMVYGLSKQLGGMTRLMSSAGRGTSVTIYLPRAMAVLERPLATTSREIAPPAPKSIRVLVVDDDDSVRDIAGAALRQAGYSVAEAKNAAEALAIIDRGDAIDLLVTDLVMPGMPGSVLAKEARLRRPGLAVMLMTGYPDEAADRDLAKHGYPVLRKPFRPAAIAAMVSDVSGKSRAT
jgi:PAS domain S-box-containing protein